MHEFKLGVKQTNFTLSALKIQIDKVMASVKKGVKYMAIISSNTNFL